MKHGDKFEQFISGGKDVKGRAVRHRPIWWQFYHEKFVEMVVLECADRLSKLGEFNSSQNIKTHFGIEE